MAPTVGMATNGAERTPCVGGGGGRGRGLVLGLCLGFAGLDMRPIVEKTSGFVGLGVVTGGGARGFGQFAWLAERGASANSFTFTLPAQILGRLPMSWPGFCVIDIGGHRRENKRSFKFFGNDVWASTSRMASLGDSWSMRGFRNQISAIHGQATDGLGRHRHYRRSTSG